MTENKFKPIMFKKVLTYLFKYRNYYKIIV